MIEYEAPEQCPFCLSGKAPGQTTTPHDCRVEFIDGSVGIMVFSWRCPSCKYRVMLDGREYGLVFASPYTAYTETFLLELAVSLSRNGCSLRSSSDLRVGFSELSAPFKYLPDCGRLRSLTTLRRGIIVYLQLAIRGLPAHVSTCSNCVGADGRIDVICFDGLQLGYKVRYKKPFIRTLVRTSAIPRASLHAHVVTDSAVAKALGTVLNASPHKAIASSKTITTINAIRGWAMAVSVLLGNVPGADVAMLAGEEQHGMKSKSTNRGWDPAKDGGVRPEFTHFLRTVFCCQLVARSLCVDITAASSDLRRRVPKVLMERIKDLVVTDKSGPLPRRTVGEAAGSHEANVEEVGRQGGRGAGGVPSIESAAAASPLPGGTEPPAGGGVARRDEDERSDGSTEYEQSDDELSSADDRMSDEDDNYEYAPRLVWNASAPLVRYAELFKERALADTGGAKGLQCELERRLRLQPTIPTTAAASLKVIHFARAVTVDPFTLWDPGGQWVALDALIAVLGRRRYSSRALAEVLESEEVRELRLLRDATACLGPAFAIHPDVRAAFRGLLLAMKATGAAYKKYVDDSEVVGEDSGSEFECVTDRPRAPGGFRPFFTKLAMACAHPSETFTPAQYTQTWLETDASVDSYKAAYAASPRLSLEGDFLASGVWAPSFPVVRPIPAFHGDAAAATDEPDCNHLMGSENKYTGGTFGAFCTCAHPKCIGVVVLDGSEGHRMPIELIVQRCLELPSRVIYDFACATLKTALCRLPFVALAVQFSVDRFHWHKNHELCTKAMNPDSYTSMEGVNTSSSEKRNALSRRQEHHLRLMKQENFMLFTTYQQALSNVIAMFRDKETELTPCKWPKWYREQYVDVIGNTALCT